MPFKRCFIRVQILHSFNIKYTVSSIKDDSRIASILITNNSVPNGYNNKPASIDRSGVCTMLKSLYGIKLFAIFLAKLKFHNSSKLSIGFGKMTPAINITNIIVKINITFFFTLLNLSLPYHLVV